MIMISMHALRFLSDAANPAMNRYSWKNGGFYPNLFISYPTLLLIDLNCIISMDFVWNGILKGFGALICCLSSRKEGKNNTEAKNERKDEEK